MRFSFVFSLSVLLELIPQMFTTYLKFKLFKNIELLSNEERVFCFSCETGNVEGVISGRGVFSAKILTTRNGERNIYCFTGSITSFIPECRDQLGFVSLSNETINSPYQKLNFNSRDDIGFDTCSRMVFLDAPMGAGKTFVADQFVKRLPKSALVLAITCRISLAKYLM
ncbi:hypothetical protein BD770DRAFT_428973 [Pilaira anomala]|nr:hypothetical protein BD770DRAFT_428973 [Pilaira anomala]